MILDKIVSSTQERIIKQKRVIKPKDIKSLTHQGSLFSHYSFKNALKKDDISVITEVKKGSPSKGIIAQEFDYVQIAKDYQASGASAISVLTEPYYFLGINNYLSAVKKNVSIPVLRKDFIIDEYQIYEAAIIGADAILLIAAILDENQIKEYIDIAKSLGMDCLVEIHDELEAEKAVSANAEIIGINNRNLKDFIVDINNTTNLLKYLPKDKIIVSESGIKTNADIMKLRQNNVNAVLIGETFMLSSNKAEKMKELLRHE